MAALLAALVPQVGMLRLHRGIAIALLAIPLSMTGSRNYWRSIRLEG